MKKKVTIKKILIALLLLLVIAQFFRIDKSNKLTPPEKDVLVITKPGAEISSILKESCYDCHSNEVTYPWYTNIAPVSWWIKHHVNEGTHHLNFSEWGNYSSRKADHKLEECVEMVEEDEMPMGSYTLMHGKATLTKQQRELLVKWFTSLRTYESDQEGK
ncbi:cytochrome C [Sphingobacteriaceae bacterium]|nr:cytochrome C [Sphingobacteriaceae bacterium]